MIATLARWCMPKTCYEARAGIPPITMNSWNRRLCKFLSPRLGGTWVPIPNSGIPHLSDSHPRTWVHDGILFGGRLLASQASAPGNAFNQIDYCLIACGRFQGRREFHVSDRVICF